MFFGVSGGYSHIIFYLKFTMTPCFGKKMEGFAWPAGVSGNLVSGFSAAHWKKNHHQLGSFGSIFWGKNIEAIISNLKPPEYQISIVNITPVIIFICFYTSKQCIIMEILMHFIIKFDPFEKNRWHSRSLKLSP